MSTKVTPLESMKVTAGWLVAALSLAAFVWDGLTPGAGFPGTLAIGLAVLTAAIYLGGRTTRTVRASTAELTKCLDESIGGAVQFGRDSERRRSEDRAPLASVTKFPGKGGKR